MRLKLPFESDEARVLNREIMETVYFAALETSMELARQLVRIAFGAYAARLS